MDALGERGRPLKHLDMSSMLPRPTFTLFPETAMWYHSLKKHGRKAGLWILLLQDVHR